MGLFGIMFSLSFAITVIVVGQDLFLETTIVTANPVVIETPTPTASEIPSEILALVAPAVSSRGILTQNLLISPTIASPSLTPTPTITRMPTSSPTPPATQINTAIVQATLAPTPTKVTMTPTSTFIPTQTPMPISPTPTRIIASAGEIDGYFEKYSHEYSVDINLLRKIAVCESGYNTNSKSKHGYAGMFQFSESAWRGARNRMGQDNNPDLRFNPEESIKTAAFKISRDGTGAWPSCSK